MDDEKSGHRILDTALLNYLSQLEVSYIISSQIDKTLTAPRLLQIVKNSTRQGFRLFFNSSRILKKFCCYLLHWQNYALKSWSISKKGLLSPLSHFTAIYSFVCIKFSSQNIVREADSSKSMTGIPILKAYSCTYSVIDYSQSWRTYFAHFP